MQELKNQAAASGPRVNNFPPLPSFLPIQPCFYQDFDVDIPAQFRKTVLMVYYAWMAYVLILLYNWFAGIIFYALGPNDSRSFKSIGQ